MSKFPSLVFLIFNMLGIVLGNITSSYTKSLVVELMVLLCVIIANNKNKIIYVVAIVFSIYGSFVTIHMKTRTSFVEYIGRNIRINANIVSQKTTKNDNYYYIIETNKVQFKEDTKDIKKKLLLVTDKDLFGDSDVYGREINFIGEVRHPTKNRNVGGFNYKGYLDYKNIEGRVFARGDFIKIGDKTKSNKIIETGIRLKRSILRKIDKLLEEKEAALLKGMLLGDTQYLPQDVLKNFRDMGLVHMLSVSGINVVYIVLILKSVFKVTKFRYKIFSSIIIVMLGVYVLIVGFTPSLMRATIMTMLTLMGEVLFYKANTISNLIIAALTILIVNPFSLYSMGFQFSFVATLFVVLFANKIEDLLEKYKLNSVLIESIAVSLAVKIGVIPLEIYYFNKVSIGSMMIAILMSPVQNLIIFLGIVMIFVGSISTILSKPLAILVGMLVKFIYIITNNISMKNLLNINAVYIGLAGVVLYYTVICCVYTYKKCDSVKIFFGRYRNHIVIAGTIVMLMYLLVPRSFKVNFIDVGQGDCALIKTSCNKNVLVDGGEKINVSDIINNKVSKIDVMIATHGHMDHIGGLIDIVNDMKVKKLIIPDTQYMGCMNELLDNIDMKKTTVYKCKNKDIIYIDRYTKIEFLNPDVNSELEGENDNSLVFKLCHKDKSFLFTADISSECENKILQEGRDLKADVLKVAHHGSDSSTGSDFIAKVNPKVAVISVGEHNKFNHPASKVLEELRSNNVEILRTDKGGQITIKTNGKKMYVHSNIQCNVFKQNRRGMLSSSFKKYSSTLAKRLSNYSVSKFLSKTWREYA